MIYHINVFYKKDPKGILRNEEAISYNALGEKRTLPFHRLARVFASPYPYPPGRKNHDSREQGKVGSER